MTSDDIRLAMAILRGEPRHETTLAGGYSVALTTGERNLWAVALHDNPDWQELTRISAEADAVLALLHKCHPTREDVLTAQYIGLRQRERVLEDRLFQFAEDWHRQLRTPDPTTTPPAPAA